MKIYHFYGYTVDYFGLTDKEWTKLQYNIGINYALRRINEEGKFRCSVHNYTRKEKRYAIFEKGLTFFFHPVSFCWAPDRIYLSNKLSFRFYKILRQMSCQFLRWLQEELPDLVVFDVPYGYYPYYIAYVLRKRGIPYIVHTHGGNLKGTIIRKKFFLNANAIITVSKSEKNQISQFYRYDPNCIHVIPVGADCQKFKPYNGSKKNTPFPHLLYVGRIDRRKGVIDVVKCFEIVQNKFKDARLSIVGPEGDKNYHEEIKSYLYRQKLQNRVDMTGHVDNDQLVKWYNKADIFIFPSRAEGNPGVVMEAMACGTPVVALKNTGGHNEVIINGENGVLTEIKNLASEVIDLLENRALLRVFSEESRKIITKFYSFENVLRRHNDLYTKLLISEKK